MVYLNGRRGKSKAKVRLSVNTTFQGITLHVWEGHKITHSFYPDAEFCRALIAEAQKYLDHQSALQVKHEAAK